MSNQNCLSESMSAHSLSFKDKIRSIWSYCNDFMTNRGYDVPRFSFRGFHLSPSIYYSFHMGSKSKRYSDHHKGPITRLSAALICRELYA